MPQIVVTQTAKEYRDYTKKKARELRERTIVSVVFFVLMLGTLYYILWGVVHIGG